MGDPLSEFLKCDKQPFGDTNGTTHVMLTGGSFIIDMCRFQELYAFLGDNYADRPFSLAECRMQETVLTIDVDYRAEYTEDHLYNLQTHVMPIHREIIRLLEESVIGGILPEDLSFVLLEKLDLETGDVLPPQICDNHRNVKQGFHMQYINIVANTRALTEYIVKPLHEKYADVDLSSCSNAWLVYGATKTGESYPPPYTVTGYYDKNGVAMSVANAYNNYIFPDACALLDDDTVDTKFRKLLSVRPYGRNRYKRRLQETTPLSASQVIVLDNRQDQTRLRFRDVIQLDHIKELVALLPASLASDRDVWLKLGFCLWQITNASEDGLKIWIEFSAKCPEKFSLIACEDLWDRQMRHNAYTIATLKYMAKKYNLEGYRDWTTKLSFSDDELQITHVNLARIMYNTLNTDYVCGNIKADLWYMFNGVVWSEKGAYTLRSMISDNNGPIQHVICQHLSVLGSMLEEVDDNKEAKAIDKKIEVLHKALLNLGNSSYKTSVMRECAELFYKEDFVQQLDTNPYIIAFKNGVYDFKTCIFRQGEPEDMLSKMLPIKYLDNYNTIDLIGPLDTYRKPDGIIDVAAVLDVIYSNQICFPELKEVLLYFTQTFPDRDIREYFVRQTSKVFVGGNCDKVCLFWTGNGNNGKTVTQTLYERMLGKYAVKMSTTVITGKKPCSAVANPELARLANGVRWVVIEEPNNDEMINPGTLKSLTGNDTFFARDLYCSGKETAEITPMFKMHCICNTLPGMRQADLATWNRVRVVPFEAIFVSEERYNRENPENMYIQKSDPRFIDNIPHMIEPLAWLLVFVWMITRGEPSDVYTMPEKVLEATKEYQRENNHMETFIETMVIKQENSVITYAELFKTFTEWLAAFCPGNTQYATQQRVIYEFSAYSNCKRSNNTIRGYAFRDTTDNE
ncbi:putative helicase [Scale drop disease virus]|uniref:Putative helicase n=1 Tax=Scale drop disease virus TaxID=1697349 RepID=A0A7D5YKL0_9VIRU|nr:putative helicase [Scale drop disease virus]QXJ13631.1 ORF040R [Scale drop disease virus]UNH60742.1 putative helicase [Scale drop disease virus]